TGVLPIFGDREGTADPLPDPGGDRPLLPDHQRVSRPDGPGERPAGGPIPHGHPLSDVDPGRQIPESGGKDDALAEDGSPPAQGESAGQKFDPRGATPTGNSHAPRPGNGAAFAG